MRSCSRRRSRPGSVVLFALALPTASSIALPVAGLASPRWPPPQVWLGDDRILRLSPSGHPVERLSTVLVFRGIETEYVCAVRSGPALMFPPLPACRRPSRHYDYALTDASETIYREEWRAFHLVPDEVNILHVDCIR